MDAFAELGRFLGQFGPDAPAVESALNFDFHEHFDSFIRHEANRNNWFTLANLRHSMAALSYMMRPEKLERWRKMYPELDQDSPERVVGLVMAGNIPLVGFHDLLCVLLAGHKALVKPSSKDDRLIKALVRMLVVLEPSFGESVVFTDDRMAGFEAMIATGSDNTARYFHHYFDKYPNIIRKNRNSVAILTGAETPKQMRALSHDMHLYFGLGCRNVSKLFIPRDFDLALIFENAPDYQGLLNHSKYKNNYDYHKSIFMVNRVPFFDNGLFMLREAEPLASPVSVAHLRRYDDLREVADELEPLRDKVQCLVSDLAPLDGWDTTPLGKTQWPEPWDYADQVDTLRFLLELR